MDNVKTAYEKLVKKTASLSKEGDVDRNVFENYQDKFAQAMGNDLNTSQAITVLYDVLKADTNDATKRALVEDFDKVLSLDLLKEQETKAADDEIKVMVEDMIAKRNEARKAKDFAKADAIRDELLSKGVEIKDTREGTVWKLI